LASTGAELAEGGYVVKVDQTGNVVQRYRCLLPTRKSYAVTGNPEGFMLPSLIRVFGNLLYVADRKGSVAKYVLPKRRINLCGKER